MTKDAGHIKKTYLLKAEKIKNMYNEFVNVFFFQPFNFLWFEFTI